MKTIFVCLIFVINVTIYSQSRDPRPKDQANVFWNGTYPLYSLASDIQISPNNSGEYIFWGTTNEDPSPKECKLLKGQVNTIYKFVDYQECVNFCNGVRKNKGMQLLQVDTEVKATKWESKGKTTFEIPDYIPLVGLVGWWPFNGNASDESGNGNNGTVDGATLTSDRQGKQAYKFDGIDDIIKINSMIDNLGTNDFSVSLWILKNDTPISETLVDKLENINSSQTVSLAELIENQGFTFNQPTDLSADENRYSLYLKDIMDDFPALKSQNSKVLPNQIIYPNADLMVIPSRETCRAVIKKLDYCRKSSTGVDCQKDLLKNKITVLRCGDLKMIGGVLGLKDEYQEIIRSGAPYGVSDLKRKLGKVQYGSISTESTGMQSDGPNKPSESLQAAWNHCMVVKSKNEVSLYLNGVKQQQNLTKNIFHINNCSDLCFGARYFENRTNEHFKGSIDDIGIWNRALTDVEIQGLYSSEQLTQTKISAEKFYEFVYEGQNDNPYSSFEDYLASTKKEKELELITNSSNSNSEHTIRLAEISKKLESISDTIQKIAYLNVVNSQINQNKSQWTQFDSSMYSSIHLDKLMLIFPDKRNDPLITKSDWRDLYDFLNFCNEIPITNDPKMQLWRAWFLYWNIMVRQNMGEEYFEIKWAKKILDEFTESNFPLGAPFYKDCQRIISSNSSNQSTKSSDNLKTTAIEELPAKLLSDAPIGTEWCKKEYTGDIVVQLKKTGANKYVLKWRDEYDNIESITLVDKSKKLEPRFYGCRPHYVYTLEKENSSSSVQVKFSYTDDIAWCSNNISICDELGKETNNWSVGRVEKKP